MSEVASVNARDKKHRSPAYPFISLQKAVDRAQNFYNREKRHPAPVAAAVQHWGFREKSSGGQQTIAALKQYGLLLDDGSGVDRRVKLTDRAFRILLDEVKGSPDRAAALREAALAPKLFADMFQKWGVDLPSDETIRTYLRRDKGFNDDVLNSVIKSYKETLDYAKPSSSDTFDVHQDDEEDTPQYAIGDYVQWEFQGVRQFPTPKKVMEFSDDGVYVFVEGEAKGIPVEQTTKADPPGAPPIQTTSKLFAPVLSASGIAREVSSLPEGEAVLQWPAALSADSVQDLEDWLVLVIKKMKRRYAAESQEKS